jgi:hypothetical protein
LRWQQRQQQYVAIIKVKKEIPPPPITTHNSHPLELHTVLGASVVGYQTVLLLVHELHLQLPVGVKPELGPLEVPALHDPEYASQPQLDWAIQLLQV